MSVIEIVNGNGRVILADGRWTGRDPDLVALYAAERPQSYHPDPDYGMARAAIAAVGGVIASYHPSVQPATRPAGATD